MRNQDSGWICRANNATHLKGIDSPYRSLCWGRTGKATHNLSTGRWIGPLPTVIELDPARKPDEDDFFLVRRWLSHADVCRIEWQPEGRSRRPVGSPIRCGESMEAHIDETVL